MPDCRVTFSPQGKSVSVPRGTRLLDAVAEAGITVNNICGGDGICGRCRMIVKAGDVSGDVSARLTRSEIQGGYVLACLSAVETDLDVEIPQETWARDRGTADRDAERFRNIPGAVRLAKRYEPSPLVSKHYLELCEPTLADSTADQQRLCAALHGRIGSQATQMGLKMIRSLPALLRENGFRVTATVGFRRDVAEIMNVEGGNTVDSNALVVVDIGTTTIVAHLINAARLTTVGARACFNSQGRYGREVTSRIISAEKRGVEELQKVLIEDLNRLIGELAQEAGVPIKDINAVVCAGNTVMQHFLLGLPVHNIRRAPYAAASVEAPPLRAVEVGIHVNPRGLLYTLPGIGGWVGSDLTAGILAIGMHEDPELSLLMDVGTNGEIIVGNRDWLVACSASAGPALEGGGEECGMRAEVGAIERVFARGGRVGYRTIGEAPAKGICGSGIIDLVSVLLAEGYLDRSGKLASGRGAPIVEVQGLRRFVLAEEPAVYITDADIANVVTAKAAIFAAMKVLLKRLDLDFSDIQRFYIAGAFGSYIDVEAAIAIGLIPDLERRKITYAGNTSLEGAKLVACYREAYAETLRIQAMTTYYDLMGADDYVEELRKAMFLPHTDIEMFGRKRA